MLDRKIINEALEAVNDWLGQFGSPLVEVIVCGGSALQVMGLIDRTTRDVDILALVTRSDIGKLCMISARILPEQLTHASKKVAKDFNLPGDWMNSEPTDLLSQGLPIGFIDRLSYKSYGAHFHVYFISRIDQICFKMYAAINGGSERHLQDLYKLTPSEDELLFAAQWCLTQDAAEIFPFLVKDFLQKVGYGNVAQRLE